MAQQSGGEESDGEGGDKVLWRGKINVGPSSLEGLG